jgi:peptidyl-prolyl cis-trans isomerase B (cyclophilin B)
MSRQRSRQQRRQDPIRRSYTDKVELPGPLRILTNPRLFLAMGLIFVAGLIFGLLPILGSGGPGGGPPQQAGELEDVPRDPGADADATSVPSTPVPVVKRYDAPPPMTVDVAKRYVATVSTTQGEFKIELVTQEAPEAVNSFVFLAQEGYYNGTRFMQVVTNADGSRFVAQAGDPTNTGLSTPGYTIRKETTSLPFSRGAVGMDSGQFYISYGDYPALNGKYTIMGSVVSGMDVIEKLTLFDVTQRGASGGDQIISVQIEEL